VRIFHYAERPDIVVLERRHLQEVPSPGTETLAAEVGDNGMIGDPA
jgi:hypothetical protein